MLKRIGLFLALALTGFVLLTACGSSEPAASEVKLAPESALPADLSDAPAEVKEAYRFAIANKELLEQIPCFCGCVNVGHTSNYACYVAEDGGPGTILQFDDHALG